MKLNDKKKLLKSRGKKIRDFVRMSSYDLYHVAFNKEGKEGIIIEDWEPTEQDYKDLKEINKNEKS